VDVFNFHPVLTERYYSRVGQNQPASPPRTIPAAPPANPSYNDVSGGPLHGWFEHWIRS
jgi:hypothetical protein